MLLHTLPVHLVERLLTDGTATALQPGTTPIPIHHDGRWWHQLADAPVDADYVPADPNTASTYTALLSRRQQADRALEQADDPGRPR